MTDCDWWQLQQQLEQQEQEMSNLELWDKVKRPPVTALKTIQAGRLKGMSDINPQWRLQAMTEAFGQCGVGWYYDIKERWTEEGAAGEVMAFIQVNIFTRTSTGWSAPIVGIGGSALVAKESSGLRANDEAYKMATTDALSVAMKQLGVAADIYMGLWDGSKYKEEESKRLPKLTEAEAKAAYEEWIEIKISLVDSDGDADNDKITEAWFKYPSNVRTAITKYEKWLVAQTAVVSETDQQAKDHMREI